MERTYRIGQRHVSVNDTVIDRVVNYFAPSYGARRLRSRLMLELAGSYFGASRSRRALSQWNPQSGSPDADTVYELWRSVTEQEKEEIRRGEYIYPGRRVQEGLGTQG